MASRCEGCLNVGLGFGHCGRSFLSTAIYKIASSKIITMSGSVFQALWHFRNASTNAIHLSRLSLWVHWYRCCIVAGDTPQWRKSFVVACPRHCRIVMVDKVLLIQFVMKYAMWKLVLSRDSLNDLRSIPSHSDMWVRFWLDHYWSSPCLEISYTIY